MVSTKDRSAPCKWPLADPAARLAHYTLYMLLIAVPIAGIVTQFARGDALSLLGIGEIAPPGYAAAAVSRHAVECVTVPV